MEVRPRVGRSMEVLVIVIAKVATTMEAMKKDTWLFRVYIGDDELPSYEWIM